MADGEEKRGIQETKEVIEALGALSGVLVAHLKDGFQAGQDLPAIAGELFLKADVRQALERAGDGIQNVPAELKDLDIEEAFELVEAGVGTAKAVVKALK